MTRDFFANKAGSYEQNKSRVDNVDNIAKAVIRVSNLDKNMHLLDFGSGTGLLLERIAPFVRKITAIDISESMNGQLELKRQKLECELEILQLDLEKVGIKGKYDGIISSMTMHHVKDIGAMFRKFYSLLPEGGFIAISDLDTEDGSFHTEDTGVYHFGFDRAKLAQTAASSGFKNIVLSDASIVHKPQGDFGVFILKANR